jgi:hypothetical protein
MQEQFKLVGLNGGAKRAYGTVAIHGEDWFHAQFNDALFPPDRQVALFKYAKETDGFWKIGITVDVEFEKYSSGKMPVKPLIVAVNIPNH